MANSRAQILRRTVQARDGPAARGRRGRLRGAAIGRGTPPANDRRATMVRSRRPSPRALLAIVAGSAVGAAAGLGGFTFAYAEGASYLSDDPTACANCHVMREQLDAWSRGSHHAVAVCNDCHAPHGLVDKLATKAKNGWNHSLAFTTGDYPEHIRITEGNRAVTEEACRGCHRPIVEAIDHLGSAGPIDCVRCHRDVGHLH
jgi:cytochrome c nitrite reductase small subunit